MPMPGRQFISAFGPYRYGMNGQEKVDEITGHTGTHYTASFWEYDSRLLFRWNTDPVIKPFQSPYACFSNNPIWKIDPKGDDDVYFSEEGGYLATKERSKLHEFFFGSKAYVMDIKGEITNKFKFNDNKDSQKKNFEGKHPMYTSINFSLESRINEVTTEGVKGAPENGISKLKWIYKESQPAGKLDYTLNQLEPGGVFEQDPWGESLNLVNGKLYNKMDAGNLLWGRSMKLLKVDYLIVKAASEFNGFYYGKMQNDFTKRNGEPLKGFSFRRITWRGDSPADQRAIKAGFFLDN